MRKRIKPTGFQILEAVRKNVCAPSPEEAKEYTVSKVIRASADAEGDSEVGILLFVGVASDFRLSEEDIASTVAIELEELRYKRDRYEKNIQKHISKDANYLQRRLYHKVRLIKNYLRITYGIS